MGGGTPIIQGGMTDAEMTAQLERQAAENDRMLAEAARQTAALEDQIAKQDQEMKSLVEQQARQQELDLASAQKKLGVELAAIEKEEGKDDLALDFESLQAALTKGLGANTNDNPRPM